MRLPLSDGDFLTVKKELNAGEVARSRSRTASARHVRRDARVSRRLVVRRATTTQPIPYQPDAIRSTNGATRCAVSIRPTIDEIVEALAPHHARESTRRRGKKNDPGTRARIMTDLALCKIMGMSYDEIRALAASRV